MYLLFALFFSSFNGIIDLPWQIVLTQKNTYFLLHFFMFFSVESAIRLWRIVLTQKVSKKVKTGSFCLILVYIFNGIGETPPSVC